MYEAKRAGRNRSVRVRREAMHTRLDAARDRELAAQRARGTAELTVVYQPIIDLQTRPHDVRRGAGALDAPGARPRVAGGVHPRSPRTSGLIVAHRAVRAARPPARPSVLARDRPERAPRTHQRQRVARRARARPAAARAGEIDVLAATGLPAELRCSSRSPSARSCATRRRRSQVMQGCAASACASRWTTSAPARRRSSCLRDYPFDVIKIDRSFVGDVATNPDVLAA
jgi:hypothetical protein